MGELEKEVRKKAKRVQVQKIIAKTLLVAGAMSVALLAPNVLQVMEQIGGGRKRKKNPKYIFNSALNKLLEHGYIRFEKTERGTFVRLTEKGSVTLSRWKNVTQIEKPKKWDGKWRIIIFDIKEKRKSTREQLRRTLQNIGFWHLQDSVWVYPYDCEDFIILLKADFKIGKDILYVIAEKLEYDYPLLKHFDLT